jgi:hypothetical protein
MKIHNFRVGFATNSSSSHSVVLIPPSEIGHVREIESGEPNHFGWDFFRLATPENKLRYLAAQMFAKIETDIPRQLEIAARFDKEIPGYADEIQRLIDANAHSWDFPSVDHQSVYQIETMSPQFLERMIAFFKSDRVVILGGNDNSDGNAHIMPTGADELEAFNALMTDGTDVKVREDGPYMILFNTGDGKKTRISFEDGVPDYIKASAPELVDLKITDYCGRGCNFCYQSSTTAGKHAPLDEILRSLDMLAEMEVFEVALGGGEPTDHPDFVTILEAATERGIKPNFTTLSDRWLDDQRVVDAVKANVGGVGVSCSDKKALELARRIKTTVGSWRGCTVMAQHVLGSVPLTVTAEFLDEAFSTHMPVLLLGFKEVGFGAHYERHDDPIHTPVILKLAMDQAHEKMRWPQLSVDTALVDQYPDLLAALGVPDALVTSPEGKFSCYIDAVEGLMGPSSYVEKTSMDGLAATTDEFKQVFAGY